jgi:hypothetical protein
VAGVTFTNDTRGNLTSDGSRSFSYDLENRLLTVSGSASGTLSYDPLGRLSTYATGGTTTTFLYSGDQLVAEYNGVTLLRRYAHGAGVDEPIARYEGATLSDRRYLIADSERDIAPDEATVVEALQRDCGFTVTVPVSRENLETAIAGTRLQSYYIEAPEEGPSGDGVFPMSAPTDTEHRSVAGAVVVICDVGEAGRLGGRSPRYAFYLDDEDMVFHVDEHTLITG